MKLILGRDDLAAAAQAAVRATGTELERVVVTPVNRAMGGFVNQTASPAREGPDICEVAVVTLLQAVACGKPVGLLPVATLGRFQHQTLVTLSALTVADVESRTVGVRSWSQTTGVWVRGFLAEQYDVDLRAVNWLTYEDGHVAGTEDPSWVKRAPAGSRLPDDFLGERLDFAILGNELPSDDRIRTAIANPDEVAADWARANGFAPVNHVVGANEAAAREHQSAILAAYDAMRAVVAAMPATGSTDLNPAGFEALRGPVTRAAAYALDQGVLARPVDFDDLVARSCAALGVPPSRLGG
jgi:4,5-dihydroxyphthalate decarboxylase